MTPERWQQIEELFHLALEQSVDRRAAYIEEKIKGDHDLRTEVERLLEQYEAADSFIEQPLFDSSRGEVLFSLLDETSDDPLTGEVLGRYRIEREIGRGGMGTVYEAVRADGEFRLRVAIKVVKRGVDTDFVLKRFRNERQILAALDHPYITRLIDGGTTDDGRPYFVMEFVDGLPIYRYADDGRLSVEGRLRLFCKVCEAVEYAHKKLVIHRDLKPSNIFTDIDGSPRLLDFGIAKLLDPEMASETLQPTATALRMMTIDYASPEQIRGEKVTYATDVYSLGVILFELLTGRRPYRSLSRNAHDVAREICEIEPPRMSIAAIDDSFPSAGQRREMPSASKGELASRRAVTLDRLIEQLQGDLDKIVRRALRKDPLERYQSVIEFREDIERHLKGEPVEVPFFFPLCSTEATPGAIPENKLVAVLPLSLLSPSGLEDTDASYLTIGLADAIITRLTSIRQLTVRPTSSITRYDGEQLNPFRAGQELGVDFVVDGRIRKFGDRLRISLQLLDVKNGSAIWARHFDERLNDVLELEDAISEQVVSALVPQLTGEEKRQFAKRGTDDARAYEAHLRGRFFWNQFTAQSIPKALDAFERAVEIDPNYALAHVGIADFYLWANIYGLIPTAEAYEKAESAARRAIEIDDMLGEAYATLGLILANRFEFDAAEKMMLRAIELAPHYSHAWEWYSALLIGTGRFKEGLQTTDRAEQLDPLSLRTKTLVVWDRYQACQFESALEKADEIIRLDPNYPQGHLQRGFVLAELGRADEAVASVELVMELMPDSALVLSHYAFVLKSAGRIDDAKKVLTDLETAAKTEYVKPMFLGFACLAAGDIDEALRHFEVSVNDHDPWVIWFGTDPKLADIRRDERFIRLMERTRNPIIRRQLSPEDGERAGSETGLLSPDTIFASELPTQEYKPRFWFRNKWKLSFAAAAILVLFGSYYLGYLSFSFQRGTNARTGYVGEKIAVLPFSNMTGDPGNEYISDGIAESLIERLSEATNAKVISRTTAFRYKGSKLDPQTIGAEVAVDSLLTGVVSRSGNDIVVDAEVIRVSDGRRMAFFGFRESMNNLTSLRDQIVENLVNSIGAVQRSVPIPQKPYTENNEAFQFYLKGEFHRQRSTPSDIRTSIEMFERAIELDPNYALAYQGLALSFRSSPAYGSLTPQVAYDLARDAAQKALSLDPNLTTAYTALASIKATYDWDFAGAEAQYKRAIEIGPNNSEARYSYGNFLVAMGRSEEALAEYRYAQQFDPLSQNIATNIGWALYIAGRYDEAAMQIKQVIERDPGFSRAYLNLGEIQQEQGKYSEAIASIQKAGELSGDPITKMALGHVYADSGQKAEARRIAVELEEEVRRGEMSPFLPAVVFAGLDEKDKSFYWLERAFQERSNWLTLIKVGRRLKNLHGDPRFDDLLKRIGF
jgi:eukaryotic-like serine/threonine-protein kinase